MKGSTISAVIFVVAIALASAGCGGTSSPNFAVWAGNYVGNVTLDNGKAGTLTVTCDDNGIAAGMLVVTGSNGSDSNFKFTAGTYNVTGNITSTGGGFEVDGIVPNFGNFFVRGTFPTALKGGLPFHVITGISSTYTTSLNYTGSLSRS